MTKPFVEIDDVIRMLGHRPPERGSVISKRYDKSVTHDCFHLQTNLYHLRVKRATEFVQSGSKYHNAKCWEDTVAAVQAAIDSVQLEEQEALANFLSTYPELDKLMKRVDRTLEGSPGDLGSS